MANDIINSDRVDFILRDKNPLAENGRNGSIKIEPDNQFAYNASPCESYIPSDANKRNAYIVFGRDRPSGWDSGYGGAGHDKCSSIDIVVGRVSSFKGTEHQEDYVNPSIGADASRIYISQKSNIDQYFGIVAGRTGQSIARAAIAIKSDDVRIVARNTIKIVTEKDSKLSANDPNFPLCGVQLIANNENVKLQPIPKGEQLIKFILELQESILELGGKVQGLVEVQKELNKQIGNHTHRTSFFGQESLINPNLVLACKAATMQMEAKVEQGLKAHANNLSGLVLKYISGGPDYINSRYHFLN